MRKVTAETFIGKPCKKCGQTLRYVKYSKQCVACKNAAKARYRARNPEQSFASRPWGHRLGMNGGEAELLFAAQNNECAICHTRISNKWCVDHCHSTGAIRGILCQPCNLLLGHAKDSVETLTSAITYLKKPR